VGKQAGLCDGARDPACAVLPRLGWGRLVIADGLPPKQKGPTIYYSSPFASGEAPKHLKNTYTK